LELVQPPPNPNRQFILDLHSWVQHLQSLNHKIILSLDNNDDLYSSEGSIHFLPFDPDNITTGPQHDGSLRTLAASCGLVDILAEQHSSRPFPPTFDSESLFSELISPFAPPCQRSLQLPDPCKVVKYKEVLHEQLQYHNIPDKLKVLSEAAANKHWMEDCTKQYEVLDTLITQSMLYAERSCSKRYTKRFEWSPALIQRVETVRYWRLLLKRSKGLSIRPSTILQAKESAHLLY